MPKYFYHCESCDKRFTTFHLMSETLERCEECGSEGFLKKLPVFPVNVKNKKGQKKVGEVVKTHIEETKVDIKKQKEELKKDYNP